MTAFCPAVTRKLEVPGSSLGRDGYCHRGFAYTVLQTAQRPGLCSDAYGTAHYKP